MSRITRNKAYHIPSPERLPLKIVIRDVLLTLLAWGLALYLCWDFLLQLTIGILNEFDTNPLNDLDWVQFSKNLRLSFLFSGSVLIFLLAWTLSNIRLLRRTQKMEGKQTEPLPLEKEVQAYGCSASEVALWRQKKVLTVAIDDSGQILEVDYEEGKVP